MALENFGFIKDLIDTNPAGSDPKSQGDDHLRGIKETLKNQFSGLTEGVPVTATETDLNNTPALANMPGKNFIINGDFSVWQRGTTDAEKVGNYLADRWKGSGTSTLSRLDLDTTSQVKSRYGLRTTSDVAAEQFAWQVIENFNKIIKNNPVTFSFTVGTISGNHSTLTVQIVNSSGTGVIETLPIVWTQLTTSVYRGEVAIPALGDVNDGENIGVRVRGTDAIDYWLADCKLELGSVATPFVPDDPATNFAKCQRYYQIGAYYIGGASGTLGYQHTFSTVMRTAPDVVVNIVPPTGGLLGTVIASGFENYGFRLAADASVTIVNGAFTADAEL